MNLPRAQGLMGRRVALFETRFSQEFANLVRKQGGDPIVGPTMVEAPLELGEEGKTFVSELCAGKLDGLIVLTGAGQRKLTQLVSSLLTPEEFAAQLGRILVAARGPKAVGALKDLSIKPQVVAPEPYTWQTLLEALAAYLPLQGKRLALQQYGVPHGELTRALEARGAEVVQVPVYRWQLPEDLAPLHSVIRAICDGEAKVVLFTSGPQAGSLIEVSRQMELESKLRDALARCAVGSIGPSCTEALRNLALEPDFEPAHGKMGHLVLEAARVVPAILAAKQA